MALKIRSFTLLPSTIPDGTMPVSERITSPPHHPAIPLPNHPRESFHAVAGERSRRLRPRGNRWRGRLRRIRVAAALHPLPRSPYQTPRIQRRAVEPIRHYPCIDERIGERILFFFFFLPLVTRVQRRRSSSRPGIRRRGIGESGPADGHTVREGDVYGAGGA